MIGSSCMHQSCVDAGVLRLGGCTASDDFVSDILLDKKNGQMDRRTAVLESP